MSDSQIKGFEGQVQIGQPVIGWLSLAGQEISEVRRRACWGAAVLKEGPGDQNALL